MSRFSLCPNPNCGKKGRYISRGYDPNPEKGTLIECRYCNHTERQQIGTDYRGYTLTVASPRKGPTGEDRYDGKAFKGSDKSSRLVTIAHLSSEDAIEHLKRNIDYWEGVEGIEEKTNRELADYLVNDLLSDLNISLNTSQARFLLEVADRLRGKGPVEI